MTRRDLPQAVRVGVESFWRGLFGVRADVSGSWLPYAEGMLDRLARLPVDIWSLDIDWEKHAATLDRSLFVIPPERTRSEERKAHEKVAAKLRQAAQLLAQPEEKDAFLDSILPLLPLFGSKATSWKMPPFEPGGDDRGPRLSEVLRAVAAMYDGDGNGRHVYGLCEPQNLPGGWSVRQTNTANSDPASKQAAHQAFENVTSFFAWATGSRQDKIADQAVLAYFPELGPDDIDLIETAKKRRYRLAKSM